MIGPQASGTTRVTLRARAASWDRDCSLSSRPSSAGSGPNWGHGSNPRHVLVTDGLQTCQRT